MKKLIYESLVILVLGFIFAPAAHLPARAIMPVDTIPIKWSGEKSYASVVVAAPSDSIVAVI